MDGQVEVYTSAWSVTHDEKNFHNPYEFIPSRWLDPLSRDIKHASQPFSLGPRGCLGRKYVFLQPELAWSLQTLTSLGCCQFRKR